MSTFWDTLISRSRWGSGGDKERTIACIHLKVRKEDGAGGQLGSHQHRITR